MPSAMICFPEHHFLFFYSEILFSMDSGFVEESFIKILDPYEYDYTFIFYLLFLTGA